MWSVASTVSGPSSSAFNVSDCKYDPHLAFYVKERHQWCGELLWKWCWYISLLEVLTTYYNFVLLLLLLLLLNLWLLLFLTCLLLLISSFSHFYFFPSPVCTSSSPIPNFSLSFSSILSFCTYFVLHVFSLVLESSASSVYSCNDIVWTVAFQVKLHMYTHNM